MLCAISSKFNEIVYWSRLPDWKNHTLTPNPDSIYLMPFINTKDVGPVAIEIPPAEGGSINGTICGDTLRWRITVTHTVWVATVPS
jgi:hypothetical protein